MTTTTTDTPAPPAKPRQTMAEKLAGKTKPQPQPCAPKDLRGCMEAGKAELIRELVETATTAEPETVATEQGAPWVSYVNTNGKPERRIDWPKYFHAGLVDLGATRGMDAEEIRETLPPPVVHGVLRQGSTMILAGASKARKSWLALALALAVRTGGRFVGFQCEQARVRYLDFELKERTGASRYALARLGLTDDPEMQAMIDAAFSYHSLRALPFEAGTIEGIAATMKAEAQAGELWIVDCLQPIMEKDPNDAVAVRQVMRVMMEAATVTGAALVLIDHYNKSSEARGMARVSGSVAKVAAVDAILTLTPKDEVIHLDFDLREDPPISGNLAVRFNSHTHGFDAVDPDEAQREADRIRREQLAEWLATGWGDGKEARSRDELAGLWRLDSRGQGLRGRISAMLAAGLIREAGKRGRAVIFESVANTDTTPRHSATLSPQTLEE